MGTSSDLRRRLVLASGLLPLAGLTTAQSVAGSFKFGILANSNGVYRVIRETTRIPRRLKETGFRFGLSFTIPTCKEIMWYEVIKSPGDYRPTKGGGVHFIEPSLATTRRQTAHQCAVVDVFWLDERSSRGVHRLDLYIEMEQVFAVEYVVFDP